MKTICEKCDQECDVHEQDDGGYENFWGSQVWHEAWTDYSDCCNAEVIEEEDDEEAA